MDRILFRLITILAIVTPSQSHADMTSQEIVKSVTDLCRGSSDSGSLTEISGGADGDLSISVLKLLGKAGVEGNFKVNKTEWKGIQQVLKSQQADDSKDYRSCVRELTPVFLKSQDSVSSEDKSRWRQELSALNEERGLIREHLRQIEIAQASRLLQIQKIKSSRSRMIEKGDEDGAARLQSQIYQLKAGDKDREVLHNTQSRSLKRIEERIMAIQNNLLE